MCVSMGAFLGWHEDLTLRLEEIKEVHYLSFAVFAYAPNGVIHCLGRVSQSALIPLCAYATARILYVPWYLSIRVYWGCGI